MQCPYCGADDDRVVDSRAADEGTAIRRRRECRACAQRYTTYERVEEVALVVRKRSGALEPFSRDKLRAGLERAATDRVDAAVLDSIVDAIEHALRPVGPEVGSDVVGMAVLERLADVDAVAYMRYASVYKDFEDLSDFEREAGELARHTSHEPLQKTTAPKSRSR